MDLFLGGRSERWIVGSPVEDINLGVGVIVQFLQEANKPGF
jgi:hypothetical protein